MDEHYKCYYCNFQKLTWDEVSTHPCFGGDLTLSINDNIIYREQDTNVVNMYASTGADPASANNIASETEATIEPPLLIHNGEIRTAITDSPSSSCSSTPENNKRKRKASTDVSQLLEEVLKQNQLQHEEEIAEKR
ncbi:hypothetical protein FQA39_LY11686 [Lamprigera yunnana]|nr:hypothetical protein FQA39_LY11686 [Lamprigera yunnana]